MCNSRPQTTAEYPYDIEQYGKATGITAAALYLPSEGCKYHTRYLKTLNTEGNTYYGYTKYKPAKYVYQGADKPSENEPDNIAEEIEWGHVLFLLQSQYTPVCFFCNDGVA